MLHHARPLILSSNLRHFISIPPKEVCFLLPELLHSRGNRKLQRNQWEPLSSGWLSLEFDGTHCGLPCHPSPEK